jgi:hypothetical protein
MIQVAICTPTAGSVKATYCASLLHMVGYYLQNQVFDGEEQAMSYNCLIGSNIGQQRDELVEDALRDPNTTHVLFIDDDMGLQADCLNLALSRRKPVVLANYRRKVQPWPFTCRKIDERGAVEVVTDDLTIGLQEIDFGGFGFSLIEVGVLRQVPRPRFMPVWIEHQQLMSTEDYPFFKAVKELGIPVYVDHDLSKKVTHVGDYAYRYGSAPFGVKVKHRPEGVEQEYKAA